MHKYLKHCLVQMHMDTQLLRSEGEIKMQNCLFCKDEIRQNAIMENDHAFVIYDKFPQTKGHVLIIPKTHSTTIFESSIKDQTAIQELLHKAKSYLDTKYKPEGYNIFINSGSVAGQTIHHTHVHLVPRYIDDDGIKKAFGSTSEYKRNLKSRQ